MNIRRWIAFTYSFICMVGKDVLIEFTFLHKKMPLFTGEFYRRITALVVRYSRVALKLMKRRLILMLANAELNDFKSVLLLQNTQPVP
jgi:hypothetical protein